MKKKPSTVFSQYDNSTGLLPNTTPVTKPTRFCGPARLANLNAPAYNRNRNSGSIGQTPPIKLFPFNPVSVPQVAIKIINFNQRRTRFTVTNIGTTVIYIGLGRVPTALAYDHTLPGCTNANDGTGGVIIDETFTGDIYAVASGTGGSIAITEMP